MSLKITSDKIIIENANGTTKFTSDNKLIYTKYLAFGSVTVSNLTIKRPFVQLANTDFAVINARILGSTGNVNGNTAVVGRTFPANGSLLVHVYGRAEGTSGACDIEYLGINVCGNQLVFNSLLFDLNGFMYKGQKSTSLTYSAIVYGTL